MTQADVSGLGTSMVSRWTGRDAAAAAAAAARDVPHIRLADDADLMNMYKFGRKLGQGGFGVVYETTHIETKTQWAIKEVCKPEPGSSKVKLLEQEIKILKHVNHSHIIHLKEVYETPKMTYLVTELCAGGELKQLLQRKKFFTEDEARHIIHSLADAIAYLHKRDIIHRDLKLENILMKNSLDEDHKGQIEIKVADFGLAVMTGGVGIENMMTDACGTLIYMAPEMMSGRCYSQWCDIWSIGIIMYMLLCGEPPFVPKRKAALLEEIMHEEVKYTQPIWATVSDAAKNLLTCLLKADPAYRMSANQLLENPWITGDTNMPAMPLNVLEMMRHYQEQETITPSPEDLCLTYAEDTKDPPQVAKTSSTERHNCRSHEKRNSFCKLFTSSTVPKEDYGRNLQDMHRNGSESQGPQPPTTQTFAGVRPPRLTSAKQRRPQEKNDLSTGRKPASDRSKDQRPCSSSGSKTSSCRQTKTSALSDHKSRAGLHDKQ